jgi:hypothetical protein
MSETDTEGRVVDFVNYRKRRTAVLEPRQPAAAPGQRAALRMSAASITHRQRMLRHLMAVGPRRSSE